MNLHHAAAAAFAALSLSCAPNPARAQTPAQTATAACTGTTLSGVVADTTAALIPGARLDLDGGRFTQTSAADGSFRFPCLARGNHKLVVSAPDFASRILTLTTPRNPLTLTLQPATVDTNVDVAAADTDGAATNTNTSGPTQTIAGKQLQQLADDPDDLLRELQQMAASAGGSNTTIAVDGFQESTALPPKSSIAYIKVNPDQFSAEYREPPFDGGRVEVYTKPGQKTYHVALFATNGSGWENARDPFSTSSAPLGKQRYGFELTGPVRKVGSDFALNLEHRSIDNTGVVDATTVDPATGNLIAVNQTIPTPQRLWIGLARVDWQLGPKNTFIASYNANLNHLANVGVGGQTLAESGYDSEKYDNMIRFSDVTTLTAHTMHEARLSLHFIRDQYTPNSTDPQLSVAGAVTRGGSSYGAQQRHWFTTEYDDDVILTPKNHTLKAGIQLINYDEHRQLPTSFNGSYTFGGGTAPVLDANNQPTGQTTTITGIQQYQRALAGLPGGAPTAFTGVSGTPAVNFDQLYTTLFAQDDWNAGHGLHIAYGLRYFTQTSPTTFNSLTPRLGVLWSPNKKGTWTLHAHAGLFSTAIDDGDEAEMLREDGVHRITTTLYSPTCSGTGDFNPATCNPTGTAIASQRQFNPHLNQGGYGIYNLGGTRALPRGWNLSLDYYYGAIWDMERVRNINSPLNGSPTGARSLGIANTNIYQLQNTAHGSGDVIFLGIEQHTIKHLTFFAGTVYNALRDNNNGQDLNTPQSSFTDAGERAHRFQGVWQTFANASLTLPRKVQLSADYHGNGDGHYNITTGNDNNGDGDFNDRPMVAPTGTPLCSTNPNANPCAYATRYGLLTSSGIPGVTPGTFLARNAGVMPWTIYLDMNLQRNFALNDPKSTHPQSLTLNIRSSNVLNHLNVTSVGGVLGSPQFGQAYAADNGRRIELGARYAF
jgi:hypothetical protein